MKTPMLISSLMVAMLALGSGCYSTQITKAEDPTPGDVQVRTRASLPLDQRKKVAVLDFDDRTDFGQGRLGRSAANVLITFLDRSGQFAIYEREKMNKLIEEQNLGVGARTDAAATAAAVGRMVGVDYVFIGTVSNFGYNSRRSELLFLGSRVTQEADATVDVRMVEVATGRIIASQSGRGVVTVESGKLLGVGTTAGYDETTAANALRAAISKYVDTLIDQGLSQK